MYKNVHNDPKLETAQVSINTEMDKQTVIHALNEILLLAKRNS